MRNFVVFLIQFPSLRMNSEEGPCSMWWGCLVVPPEGVLTGPVVPLPAEAAAVAIEDTRTEAEDVCWPSSLGERFGRNEVCGNFLKALLVTVQSAHNDHLRNVRFIQIFGVKVNSTKKRPCVRLCSV